MSQGKGPKYGNTTLNEDGLTKVQCEGKGSRCQADGEPVPCMPALLIAEVERLQARETELLEIARLAWFLVDNARGYDFSVVRYAARVLKSTGVFDELAHDLMEREENLRIALRAAKVPDTAGHVCE